MEEKADFPKSRPEPLSAVLEVEDPSSSDDIDNAAFIINRNKDDARRLFQVRETKFE